VSPYLLTQEWSSRLSTFGDVSAGRAAPTELFVGEGETKAFMVLLENVLPRRLPLALAVVEAAGRPTSVSELGACRRISVSRPLDALVQPVQWRPCLSTTGRLSSRLFSPCCVHPGCDFAQCVARTTSRCGSRALDFDGSRSDAKAHRAAADTRKSSTAGAERFSGGVSRSREGGSAMVSCHDAFAVETGPVRLFVGHTRTRRSEPRAPIPPRAWSTRPRRHREP
jgi:hypothetical protein